ncbi:MAG: glycosyltransferase [Anaerolineae bacterium]
MSVLILTPQIPWPPHQGASLRNFNIIKGLSVELDVSLLSFAESDQSTDVAPLAILLKRFETVAVPKRSMLRRLVQLASSRFPDMGHRLYSPDFFSKLEQMLKELKPDIVQIEGIELARAIPIIQQASPHSKIVFDNHNAETALQERIYETDIRQLRKLPKAIYSRIQVSKLGHFEQWACQESDIVTAVSERDAQILNHFRKPEQSPVTAIPNCIDTSNFQPVDGEGEKLYDLVFTGKMDYRPNIDAMLWFTQGIWPLIKQVKKSAKLVIVGKNPGPTISALDKIDGITVTGAVAEIAPWLNCSRVMVMPLRMGSGTRLKLIQALAAGLPVVSTSNGAEGYPVQAGEELLLGDSEDDFAQQTLKLLDSTQLQQKLGTNGRSFAEAYDWRKVIPRFIELYSQES